jgi:hypothetical protein
VGRRPKRKATTKTADKLHLVTAILALITTTISLIISVIGLLRGS